MRVILPDPCNGDAKVDPLLKNGGKHVRLILIIPLSYLFGVQVNGLDTQMIQGREFVGHQAHTFNNTVYVTRQETRLLQSFFTYFCLLREG